MRGTDFEFVPTDVGAITEELIAKYEELTGHTVNPADPERLFIAWLSDAIVKERVNMNFVGNMNIPSRAVGQYLEALGEWIYGVTRQPAAAARATVRFTITPTSSAVAIPAGTRVTDTAQRLSWATTADALIGIGESYADVMVECAVAGTVGNGYLPGQINTLVDVDNVQYFVSCQNIDTSDGGSEVESDADYFARMRLSTDAYSTAGSEGAYVYHAKAVSEEIADVRAVSPDEDAQETAAVMTNGGNKYAVIGADGVKADSVKVNGSAVTPVAHGSTLWAPYGGNDSTVTVTYKKQLAGTVYLYVLMDDGTPAGSVIKAAVLSACSAKEVRPLTDRVEVKDPATQSYDVTLTYYIPRDTSTPVADLEAAVAEAVDAYVKWQSAKLGRDINPSKLWQYLMQTGIKRAVITAPTFTALSDGSDGSAPGLAAVGTITLTNGGYEDE